MFYHTTYICMCSMCVQSGVTYPTLLLHDVNCLSDGINGGMGMAMQDYACTSRHNCNVCHCCVHLPFIYCTGSRHEQAEECR